MNKLNEPPAVRLNFQDSIAQIVIDQPNSRANTLSTTSLNDLAAALILAAHRQDLTGLVISSKKDGIFVAGADLNELYGLTRDETGLARQFLQRGLDVTKALESMPFPSVALIDGAALGGGLEIALACDYRLAGSHPKCKLGLPEVTLGLIPGWGGTQRLPRVVGLTAGTELLLSGRSVTPAEAKTLGLVDDVVPSDQLPAAAVAMLSRTDWRERRRRKKTPSADTMPTDWSAQLAQLSSDISPAAEVALNVAAKGAMLPLEQATEVETNEFLPLIRSDAARRRIEAFLKK